MSTASPQSRWTTSDTKSGGTKTVFDSFKLLGVAGVANVSTPTFDDIYFLNGAGTRNNDFLGDTRIYTIFPNGNGNSSDLVGSDGNQVDNYQQVDETAPDTSDYNGSDNSGDHDSYEYENVTVGNGGTIAGIQVGSLMAKTDTGIRTARFVQRIGGTDYYGDEETLSTSYAPFFEVHETSPDTSLTWTETEIDDGQWGMQITGSGFTNGFSTGFS